MKNNENNMPTAELGLYQVICHLQETEYIKVNADDAVMFSCNFPASLLTH